MKKVFALALLVSLFTGCAYSNQYGRCIGYLDDEEPDLKYQTSIRNVVWTVIGVETLVAPAVWFFACAKCPTGYKSPQSHEYRVGVWKQHAETCQNDK